MSDIAVNICESSYRLIGELDARLRNHVMVNFDHYVDGYKWLVSPAYLGFREFEIGVEYGGTIIELSFMCNMLWQFDTLDSNNLVKNRVANKHRFMVFPVTRKHLIGAGPNKGLLGQIYMGIDPEAKKVFMDKNTFLALFEAELATI